MADDVLTHAELEALLSATKPSVRPYKVAAPPARPSRRVLTPASSTSRETVKLYDFQRPRCVDEDDLRTLSAIHERFAASLGRALAAVARTDVGVSLVGIDQVAYSQLLSGLDNPTCLSVLRAEPLAGHLALSVSPTALFPIIDRLLGGGREPSPVVRRPLTAIELRLASRITSVLLAELRKAWLEIVDLKFSVQRVESDPQAAAIVLPGEAVVRVRLELAVEPARGMATICLPGCALRPVKAQLAGGRSEMAGRPATSRETIAQMNRNVGQATVELVAQLAKTRVTAAEMLNLREGDIITTKHDVGGALVVCVEGVPKFLAQGGVLRGHSAVQIGDAIRASHDGPGQ